MSSPVRMVGSGLAVLVGILFIFDWMMAGFPFAIFGQSVQTLELWIGMIFVLLGIDDLIM